MPVEPKKSESDLIEMPASGARCTDVLSDTLLGYAGVQQAEFDREKGNLRLSYDPRILTDEQALRLVRSAGTQAWDRVSHCAQKGEAACAACLAEMGEDLQNHYRQLSVLHLAPETKYNKGVMEIQIPMVTFPNAELSRVEKGFARPTEAPGPARFLPGLPRERLEVAFTVINALTALTAFLGEQFGLVPTVVTIMYVIAYLTGGYYGLMDGLALLRARRLDVNLLMILAALGAAVIGQPAEGAALLFLFSLSNTLQMYAMGRSRKAIEKLLDLRPSVATVRRGSRLVSLPIEQLLLGDAVLVRPGERFPIDGEVIDGSSAVDQSAITGESIPVEKASGDQVYAGTVNGNGAVEIRVTHLSQDTTLAKIVQMVEQAQSNKAETQRMLDNFEQYYALLVLGAAAFLTVVPYFIFGHDLHTTFYRAMTWLVVASPCALVISTPASILSAIANGARHGILFKGGIHLEQTALLKVIAFDKTGTLTTGMPELMTISARTGVRKEELLRMAAAAEFRSEHPIAGAVVKAAQERGIEIPSANDFQAIPGQGVQARIEGQSVQIGNQRFFDERRTAIPVGLREEVRSLENQGQTVMLVKVDGEWWGLLSVADSLRPDAAEIVTQLKDLGLEKVIMLTGDNERVAATIAARAGVDEFRAGLLPQDKVRVLKTLREKYGPTAMVGDGVNDAPALAMADVGIAMGGAGADVALETADVVLMADDLANLPFAIGLARGARRTVWQNLAFSIAVIVFLIAAAFGAQLPLPLGVVGHEGSTVLVVLNGLRLLGYRH